MLILIFASSSLSFLFRCFSSFPSYHNTEGHEVWVYSGHGEQWHKVGDGIHHLIGGGNHMYGVAGNGDIHKYNGHSFVKIGGMFSY